VEANTERFVDETVRGPGTSYQYSVTVIDAERLTRGTSFDSCDPVDTPHYDAAPYRLAPDTVVVRNGELDHRATVAEMNGPHAYVTAGIRGALRAPPTFRPDWTSLPLGQSWTARIFANGRLLEEETHTVVAMSHVGGGLYEPLFTARRTPGLHGV